MVVDRRMTLKKATVLFAQAMLKKLQFKAAHAGGNFTGWNASGFFEGNRQDWKRAFLDHVTKAVLQDFDAKSMVDIANFAMFRFTYLEKEKGHGGAG